MLDFRNLKVWEKAHKLVLETYELATTLPNDEKYNIISQIKRAVVSVPLNIAEGAGKYSNADMARFYQIALGSCQEVEYLFILIEDLGFAKKENIEKLKSDCGEVKAMLIGLIKNVRSRKT